MLCYDMNVFPGYFHTPFYFNQEIGELRAYVFILGPIPVPNAVNMDIFANVTGPGDLFAREYRTKSI